MADKDEKARHPDGNLDSAPGLDSSMDRDEFENEDDASIPSTFAASDPLIPSPDSVSLPVSLPVFVCGSSILFPGITASFDIRRGSEPVGIASALRADRKFLAVYTTPSHPKGSPTENFHRMATLAAIVHHVPSAEGGSRLVVEGVSLVRILSFDDQGESATFHHHVRLPYPLPEDLDEVQEAELRALRARFSAFIQAGGAVQTEVLAISERTEDGHALCDLILSILPSSFARKYPILIESDPFTRIRRLTALTERETTLSTMQKTLAGKVKSRIERSQREYFLNEKLKEINRELGRDEDENETAVLGKTLAEKNPPAEVLAKAKKELARLSRLQSLSPEAGVVRNYCEWLADLPWSILTTDSKDIGNARMVLNEDHYGLAKPKDRILEFIAIRQLSDRARGPILCLVGPPGTGKTSLGRSLARALDRKFVRISLGGVRDEAEIRGHRRTYIGALPGKIIQSLRKAGSSNPVFLLDEVDKMSSDFRGDPASALLEVLDPEQNSSFSDHFLEVPYDLSRVLFVMTANSIQGIPPALLDRMEIIEITGYGEREKLEIARRHLIPKQLRLAGMAPARIRFRNDAILELVRHYTMESGVRNLEREIASVLRKLATRAVGRGFGSSGEKDLSGFSFTIGVARVHKLLGKERRRPENNPGGEKAGVARGLAWTQAGGSMLPVETLLYEGEERLLLTGNLGEVMKESARTAFSLIRSRVADFGLDPGFFKGKTVHVHVPEGAIPKDGPSAGITIAASIRSAATGRVVSSKTAMTGEITLTGDILPVGGIREKLLAASRNGMLRVLLPAGNRDDIGELPPDEAKGLEFHFIRDLGEAFALTFPPPVAGEAGDSGHPSTLDRKPPNL